MIIVLLKGFFFLFNLSFFKKVMLVCALEPRWKGPDFAYPPVFVNTVSLQHGHSHLLKSSLWLLYQHNGGVEFFEERPSGLPRLKYFLVIGSKFANP